MTITAQEQGLWQTRLRAAKDWEVAVADALCLVQTYPGLTCKIQNCLQKSQMRTFLLGSVPHRGKDLKLARFWRLCSSCLAFSSNCIQVPPSPCLTVWLFTQAPPYLERNSRGAPRWALTGCQVFGGLSCFICTVQKRPSTHGLFGTRNVSGSAGVLIHSWHLRCCSHITNKPTEAGKEAFSCCQLL